MFAKKILMIMTALFLFCGCAAEPAKTSAISAEQAKTEEKQNSSVSENTDQKHTEQVSKSKKQALNTPSEKESVKAEKEKGKAVSKTEKKSKSKKNTVSSEKKVSSSPVISEDTSDSHIHDWVHHEATGHYDTKVVTDQAAWDEVVVDQEAWTEEGYYRCNTCGYTTPDSSQMTAHFAYALENDTECAGATDSYVEGTFHPSVTHTVHHEAVTHTEQVWVQDADAYDECSICGVKK